MPRRPTTTGECSCGCVKCIALFDRGHTYHGLSSDQSLSRVRFFATPRTAARQASLSVTNSRSLCKPMSIESVRPSNHLILCRPLLLLPSIFPSIRVFSNESLATNDLRRAHSWETRDSSDALMAIFDFPAI